MPNVEKISIVFKGSKFYWRTRNSIDVTIVQHDKANIIEIIAYEPSIDVEAERIYLNATLLNDRLDHVEIEAKFSFAKQNNVPISTAFITSVTNHAITDYILTRLLISKFCKEESQFEIKLEFSSRDTDPALGGQPLDGLFCGKAEELKPFETKKHKLLPAEEVSAALRALEDDRTQLRASCEQAAIHHTEASVPLTVKERWRIPIVLGKLDKGKVLNAGDTKIWEAVANNLKTQEDIDRVTKVTMRTVTTKAQLDAAKNAAIKRRQRAHTSTNRVPASPSRSSHQTPRSQTVTPRATPRATPRTLSSRLLAGTAASQARAQCAAEDLSPTPTAPKTPRKLAKRSSSKVIPVRNSSKTIRHTNTRSRLTRPRGSSDVIDDNYCLESEADHSDSVDHSAALEGENDTSVSFASQVAAGLSSFVSTFSTKSKPSSVSTKSSEGLGFSARSGSFGEEARAFPSQASFGAESGSGDFSHLPPQQHNHIADLVFYLVGNMTSSVKISPAERGKGYIEFNAVADDFPRGKPSLTQGDNTLTADSSVPLSEQPSSVRVDSEGDLGGTVAIVAPTKRRSFFGSILAPFVRTDSGAQLDPTMTDGDAQVSNMLARSGESHKMEAPRKRRSFFGALLSTLGRANSGLGGHNEANVCVSVSEINQATVMDKNADSMGDLPAVGVSNKAKPDHHHATYSESLSGWLPWKHTYQTQSTTSKVHSTNLVESVRAQFAE